MKKGQFLLSGCIATLSLAISGQEVIYPFLFGSIILLLAFFVVLMASKKMPFGLPFGGVDLSSALLLTYALCSSILVFSNTGDPVSILSTAPFIVMPLIFLAVRSFNLDLEDISLDVERLSVHSAIIFSLCLVISSPSEFLSSLLSSSRFTWTEFRAVNPLPVVAACLILFRRGWTAVVRPDFLFLAAYIYGTKYVNWQLLLIASLPMVFIIRRLAWVNFAAILAVLILIIGVSVGVNWQSVAASAPGEFDRIYELRLALDRFQESPIFGIGFGSTFANASLDQKYSMHNLLAYMMSFGGIAGLGLLLWNIAGLARIGGHQSMFLMVVYLIFTATAASFKLPGVQLFFGLSFAMMSLQRVAANQGGGFGAVSVARAMGSGRELPVSGK
jgi:hypothetical protein